MNLKCPECGKQCESGKFCTECGVKLQEIISELVCPSCGYKAKSGKFCSECGTKLIDQIIEQKEEKKAFIVKRQFNEKDTRFTKYYNKKGCLRDIPQEERSMAVEELTSYVDQKNPEAQMLLGNILFLDSDYDNKLKGLQLISEAEKAGDKMAYYIMGFSYFYGMGFIEQNQQEAEKRMLEYYQEYHNGDSAAILALLYTESEKLCDYKKAYKYAKIAAEEDEEMGYLYLGYLYQNGWGVKQNVQLALENYKMAAAQGNADAMNQIGYLFMGNGGIDPDASQSFYWFNESAKKSSVVGMYNLGCCYRDGFGVETDAEKAAEWFKKSAELGYTQAMCNLGDYYQKVLVDLGKAKNWYLKAAELDHVEAQNKLAVYYADVEKDYREAIKWYKKGMEQDYPWSYRNYALCLWNGDGVKVNKKKAVEMMRKAIELGCPDAEEDLGNMQNEDANEAIGKANALLNDGNFKDAVTVYKKYAVEGNPHAMANLGNCMLNGNGIEQNFPTGIEWLTKAADAGDAFACLRLVEAYGGWNYNGKSVKVNQELSRKYFEAAKECGADPEEVKVLETKMIPHVRFSNIQVKKNVTLNGELGFEVVGDLLVNGLAGEKLDFSVYCIMKNDDKECINLPGCNMYRKYSEKLVPSYMSTVWSPFKFFISYKSILSKQADLYEDLHIVVWHKSGKRARKILIDEYPFRIACKTHLFRSDEYTFYMLKK